MALVAATAKPVRTHAVQTVRLALEPGVSFAFSSDWYACDKELDSRLHARTLPAKLAHLVCPPDPDGDQRIRLSSLLMRAPVSLSVEHDAMATTTPEALSAATPLMRANLETFLCAHVAQLLGLAPQSLLACAADIATVSQHPALMNRLLVKAQGRTRRLRLYWIPYGQGEVALVFENPIETDGPSAAEIDRVVASVEIEPGSLPVQSVSLSPAPGISLAVPYGWMACDDATNTQLGKRTDRLGVRAKSCADNDSTKVQLFAFNPQPLLNASVAVSYKTDKDLSESDIAALTPEKLTALTPQACDSVTKPLKERNQAVDSCVLSIEEIAGHQAVLATVVGAFSEESPQERARSRIYFVPYAQGYVTLQFTEPTEDGSLEPPLIDAVRKSLTIQ